MAAVLMINLPSALNRRKMAGAFLYAKAAVTSIILLPLFSFNYLTSARNLTSNHKPMVKLDFNLQKHS
jgi:hypothetical protein